MNQRRVPHPCDLRNGAVLDRSPPTHAPRTNPVTCPHQARQTVQSHHTWQLYSPCHRNVKL